MDCNAISFSGHAIQRMFERAITLDDVRIAMSMGEVIADYPEDVPYPSVLVLAIVAGRPLHVVAARDGETGHCYVITAYIPDPALWGDDFRTRRAT
jgi:Domain of unknown function (DUF4258)